MIEAIDLQVIHQNCTGSIEDWEAQHLTRATPDARGVTSGFCAKRDLKHKVQNDCFLTEKTLVAATIRCKIKLHFFLSFVRRSSTQFTSLRIENIADFCSHFDLATTELSNLLLSLINYNELDLSNIIPIYLLEPVTE